VEPTAAPTTPSPGQPGATAAEGPLYRVQIGAYSSRDNADERIAALRADGFSAYVVREGGLFKVRVGAFRDRARADELAQRLRAKGYEVIIVR
jgi:N-acetylmuramoyl-L-alanine amidase